MLVAAGEHQPHSARNHPVCRVLTCKHQSYVAASSPTLPPQPTLQRHINDVKKDNVIEEALMTACDSDALWW